MGSLFAGLILSSLLYCITGDQLPDLKFSWYEVEAAKTSNSPQPNGEVRYTPDWASLDSRPVPQWYKDAKFGIFMHWSVFSVTETGKPNFELLYHQNSTPAVMYMNDNYRPGTTYSDLCRDFTARYFDATQWLKLFEKAGARYIVPISKHLEGFCNWDTKYSPRWNSVDCGPRRDLIGELAAATKKTKNIKFGVYHGMMDVLNPIWMQDHSNKLKTNNYVIEKTTPQLHELITKYEPELLWSDADYDASWEYWNSTGFLSWLYNDSPVKDTVVANDRWGQNTHCKHGGFMTCADNYNPKVLQKRYFECCKKTTSDWAYRKQDTVDQILTPTDALTQLVQVVSCGGNLLLNIPPTFDGVIMPVFQHLLSEMGMYLERNGEGIYGSVTWTTQNDTASPNVWYTRNKTEPTTVYACITDHWPGATLELAAPKPLSVYSTIAVMFGNPGLLKWEMLPNGNMRIDMPILYPDTKLKHGWVIKLTNVK